MIQSQKHNIVNKVFSLEDLKSLASFLIDESSKIENSKVNFDVSYSSNLKVSDDSLRVFEDPNVKSLDMVSVEMFLIHEQKRIDIVLSHGWNTDWNYFRIVGKDEAWVKYVEAKILAILGGVPSQLLGNNYKLISLSVIILMLIVLTYFIGGLLLALEGTIVPNLLSDNMANFVHAARYALYVIALYIALHIVGKIEKKFDSIFPIVDLSIGLRRQTLKRRVANLVLQIVLPLLLAPAFTLLIKPLSYWFF